MKVKKTPEVNGPPPLGRKRASVQHSAWHTELFWHPIYTKRLQPPIQNLSIADLEPESIRTRKRVMTKVRSSTAMVTKGV